jgi:hypothetical protein
VIDQMCGRTRPAGQLDEEPCEQRQDDRGYGEQHANAGVERLARDGISTSKTDGAHQ